MFDHINKDQPVDGDIEDDPLFVAFIQKSNFIPANIKDYKRLDSIFRDSLNKQIRPNLERLSYIEDQKLQALIYGAIKRIEAEAEGNEDLFFERLRQLNNILQDVFLLLFGNIERDMDFDEVYYNYVERPLDEKYIDQVGEFIFIIIGQFRPILSEYGIYNYKEAIGKEGLGLELEGYVRFLFEDNNFRDLFAADLNRKYKQSNQTLETVIRIYLANGRHPKLNDSVKAFADNIRSHFNSFVQGEKDKIDANKNYLFLLEEKYIGILDEFLSEYFKSLKAVCKKPRNCQAVMKVMVTLIAGHAFHTKPVKLPLSEAEYIK